MQAKLSRGHPLPLHHQLRDILEQQIRGGVWAPHQMIPTENDLIERYEVSRTTVRQALAALVTEGLLYRVQGKGTFVARARIAEPLSSLLGFTEVLQRQGHAPVIQILGVDRDEAPSDASGALLLPPRTPITVIERRIDLGGEPLFWDHSFLAQVVTELPDAQELRERPLFHWLERAGYRPAEAVHTMAARAATPEEALVLDVERATPVMVVRRTAYTEEGWPLIYSRAIYRSDRYEYEIKLRR